jgi:hypothetical protein
MAELVVTRVDRSARFPEEYGMSDRISTEPPQRRGFGLVAGITALTWVALSVIAFALASDTLPFDRPRLGDVSTLTQLVNGWLNLLAAGVLIAITYLVTRRQAVPDVAARAPERASASREAGLVIGYVVVAQAAGFVIGHALGAHAISLHLPGALFGTSNPPSAGWVFVWAGYNLIAYAVLPFLYFRWRGYSNEQLNLRSVDRRADLTLILVILAVESLFELTLLGRDLFALSATQAVQAMAASFAINFHRHGAAHRCHHLRDPAPETAPHHGFHPGHGRARRPQLRRGSPLRRMDELQHGQRRRAERDLRRPPILRPWHDQDSPHPADRQHLGTRVGLPRDRPARHHRRARHRQTVPHPLTRRRHHS